MRWSGLALAGVAVATGAAAGGDDPLAGRVAGPPQACVDRTRLTGPDVRPGLIVYRQNGERVWAQRPDGKCPGLRWDTRLIIENTGLHYCAGDRFQVAYQGSPIPSGHCRFGKFTPYDKEPR